MKLISLFFFLFFFPSSFSWIEEEILIASDGTTNAKFGSSVSIYENYIFVSSSGNDSSQGSVYIFYNNKASWVQIQELTSSDFGDNFGSSVSIYGSSAAIGASGFNSSQGAAYIFSFNGTLWNQQQKLLINDGLNGDQFGISVSIWDTSVAIGASGFNSNQGCAYIFFYNGTSWIQQGGKLTANDGVSGDHFGISIALSGAFVFSSAPQANSSSGAVYTFDLSGDSWIQTQKLVASDGASNDLFGSSISHYSNYGIIGASGFNSSQGAAYIFYFNGNLWNQQQKLLINDGLSGDQFGISVSIWGTLIAIGASGFNSNQGCAYTFSYNGSLWIQQDKLSASDASIQNDFGNSIAVDSVFVIVGAIYSNSNQGSVYVFNSSSLSTTEAVITTNIATTNQITTNMATTNQITTNIATTNQITTNIATTNQITTNMATTTQITTNMATTTQITTNIATTNQITTNIATTNQITTNMVTTNQYTINIATTNQITTNMVTTNQHTTNKVTTKQITTNIATTNQITTNMTTNQHTTNMVTTNQSSNIYSITMQVQTNLTSPQPTTIELGYTGNITNSKGTQTSTIIGAVIGTIVVLCLILVLIVLVILLKKRRKRKTNETDIELKELDSSLKENVEIVGELGEGKFGKVYKAKLDHFYVACKKLNEEGAQEIEHEIKILKSLKHQNIVTFIGVKELNNEKYIVMEYMNSGDLLNYLRKHKDIKDEKLINIAFQIACGMEYLEKNNIIHRDLAARNILCSIDEDLLICKISDFGLSTILNNYYSGAYSKKTEKPISLPIKWSAPELILREVVTIKSDVFSFGVVLFELFSKGEVPWAGFSNQEVVQELREGKRMKFPKQFDYPEIIDLINECWKEDPNERPTFKHLYERFCMKTSSGSLSTFSENSELFYLTQ